MPPVARLFTQLAPAASCCEGFNPRSSLWHLDMLNILSTANAGVWTAFRSLDCFGQGVAASQATFEIAAPQEPFVKPHLSSSSGIRKPKPRTVGVSASPVTVSALSDTPRGQGFNVQGLTACCMLVAEFRLLAGSCESRRGAWGQGFHGTRTATWQERLPLQSYTRSSDLFLSRSRLICIYIYIYIHS